MILHNVSAITTALGGSCQSCQPAWSPGRHAGDTRTGPDLLAAETVNATVHYGTVAAIEGVSLQYPLA